MVTCRDPSLFTTKREPAEDSRKEEAESKDAGWGHYYQALGMEGDEKRPEKDQTNLLER